LIWVAVGLFLLPLGITLLVNSPGEAAHGYYPLINYLAPYVGGAQQAALGLIIVGLFIGYAKGKAVLGKSARRGVARILTFPNPTQLTNIYSPVYYMLLGGMVLLGMSIKWLGIANDIRGVVDVAIGSALINGALVYFRLAFAMRKTSTPCA
jgi:hypothetical protein